MPELNERTRPAPPPGLDRITADDLVEALHGVRHGRIYELGTEFGRSMPQGPVDNSYGFRLTQYRTPRCIATTEEPGFDSSMEVIAASPHVGTHIDGLAHIQSHGLLFGGYRARDVYSDFGWQQNGMEHSKPIVGRGVLIDVPRHKGVDCLPDRYEVTPADVEEALAAQKTQLRRGDMVLVRTGWFAAWYRIDPDTFFASQPGVGPDGALWLYERGMSLLGTDTSGTEVCPLPNPERTTHRLLIVERGVHIIETLDLEALAADEVHEFLFVTLPLPIVGGTGSWLRPIAII
jgi:kynurenine formamidase